MLPLVRSELGDHGSLTENVWRAPLWPIALAFTGGILLDRALSPPLLFHLLLLAGSVLIWFFYRANPRPGLPLVYLLLGTFAVGAAYHHAYREIYHLNDIGELASEEAMSVQVRGQLIQEPWRRPKPKPDPLRPRPRDGFTSVVLQASQLLYQGEWVPVSGRVQLWVRGEVQQIHAGDTVEVVGKLSAIMGPGNPGEFDAIAYARDRRIRARLAVGTPAAISRLERTWPHTLQGWLARARGWGQDVLQATLPSRTQGVACALLLGEGAPMSKAAWDKYIYTGVIHILAISGQHLVIISWFLWFFFRVIGLRQRQSAILVAVILLSYAAITGMRPPALRSAVTVCAVSGAILCRRSAMPANLFALAWLVVLAIHPTDVADVGCQFSFLAVAVLYWGTRDWGQRELDPLEKLIEENQPFWQRWLRWCGESTRVAYLATAFIWLLITPLTAARYGIVSPAGVVLGPPLAALTSVALLMGFLLLGCAVVCWPLVPLLTWTVDWPLALIEWLVDISLQCPGCYFFVGEVPEWWLWIFYVGLLAYLTQPSLRQRWRWVLTAGLGWVTVGLLVGLASLPSDELRCTFLSVGHGGCTILETPDGRTLLYDAGAIAGPEVARRHITPFLRHRGIRRIDEVFLSHADLDHFNGLRDLLDRFTITQVSCTPTFQQKKSPGVRHTLEKLAAHGIPVRIVKAGDRLHAGDVQLDVLHPPPQGPMGPENVRSMVLCVHHQGHTILLTGDLEKEGFQRVRLLPRRRIDVLMAPHHGSSRANTRAFADWARPRVVIACQGPPWGATRRKEPYSARGIRYLSTWRHGAVTVRSHPTGLLVETYRTRERIVVAQGGGG